ncbi:hypothetical protein J2847_006462 [Azospirillum agricola]|uniref:hypothetical protein n=1 Tax=Azospirillum agricola TaxID=1720247 RepID=UPI001AE99B2D|nr:hypothetical protein [Azospirillum agricola]MBP2233127.1 hypothetical protein [Azospirillum agricola]
MPPAPTHAALKGKAQLEPYYHDCLDEIAKRTGIADGATLLDALLDQPGQTAHSIRSFVIGYYRGQPARMPTTSSAA